MIVDKTCLNCGTQFRTKHTEVGKFCSKTCYRAHEKVHGRPNKTVPVAFNCQHCGNEFRRNPGELRSYRAKFGKDPMYCTIECSAVGRRESGGRWTEIHCIQCAKPMPHDWVPGKSPARRRHLCSKECRGAYWRDLYQAKHPDQEPTRRTVRGGYVYIRLPGKDGSAPCEMFEHRYVMEQHLGRPLRKEETVHHRRSGNRSDNSLGNLELFASRHGPGQRVADQIAWAIQLITDYPEFASEVGVQLVKIASVHDSQAA